MVTDLESFQPPLRTLSTAGHIDQNRRPSFSKTHQLYVSIDRRNGNSSTINENSQGQQSKQPNRNKNRHHDEPLRNETGYYFAS